MRINASAFLKGKVTAKFSMDTESLLKRERNIVYWKEEDYRVPSLKCRDFGVFSMSKTSSQ
jgi:hypothetical protein